MLAKIWPENIPFELNEETLFIVSQARQAVKVWNGISSALVLYF